MRDHRADSRAVRFVHESAAQLAAAAMAWCGARRHARRFGGAAVLAAAALCLTCKHGEVLVVEPAAAGHGPLILSVQPDPEDSAIARRIGWSAGIPAAEVTISPAEADTATGPPLAILQTDSAGAMRGPDLPDGHYLIEVQRLLTTAELARLGPADDAIGFFGLGVVPRSVASGSATVAVPASHRRSVVISEWAFNPEWSASKEYYFGGFLELVNNSDTTVYLDGLVLGEAYALAYDDWPGACAASEASTNDPDGVWARYFDSVPGTGHRYPLAPGATAILATDAVDHSAFVAGALDLSHAGFEWIGTGDVDNPSVPNLIDIGVGSYPWYGHGPLFLWQMAVPFVALPLDVAALPMTPGRDYVRVPRAKILDVVALRSRYQFGNAFCPHLVHTNFDRHPAYMLELGYKVTNVVSAHRKVAYTRPDGRRILQHTRTGIADFIRGPRTPGLVP